MLVSSLSQFLHDERGSYTLWSVAWFMFYVGIGGLAVDATDVYRHETLLQATADSSAMAGALSLPNKTDAVDQALAYAQDNMQRSSHGTVLTATDVILGTWNFDDRVFTKETADPNAVYVTTRREESNENALPMNMLRFFGLVGIDPWWNVHAEAVAVRAIAQCHNNGLIAGGRLRSENQTDFTNNICLHGVEGMKTTQNNTYEEGVSTSTTCSGQDCVNRGPNGLDGAMDLEGFPPAWNTGGGYDEPLFPLNASMIGNYVEALRDVHAFKSFYGDEQFVSTYNLLHPTTDYSGWEWMFAGGTVEYESVDMSVDGFPTDIILEDPENAKSVFTVYEIDCKEPPGITLPNGIYRNVAIITNCSISTNSSGELNLDNVVIVADYEANQLSQDGIHFSGNANLGGNTACGSGGGVELMTTGSSIRFAANANVRNTRILSAGDVSFGAGAGAEVGAHIEAKGDINLTSRNKFGLCDNENQNKAQQFTYRIVH